MKRTKNTMLLVAARLSGQIIAVISIPLIIAALGREGYGLCQYLIALGPFISMVDVGICEGLNRMLISRIGQGKMDEALNIHRSLDMFLIAYTVGQTLIFTAVGFAQQGSVLLFAATGLMLSAKSWLNYTNSWHAGHNAFGEVAIANTINNVASAILSLFFVLVLRRPIGFLLGIGLASTLAAAYIRLRIRAAGHEGGTASFDHIREAFDFGRKFIWTKLANALSGTSDKLILKQQMGDAALGSYSAGTKIPEAGYDVLPISTIVGTEMIQSKDKGPEAFAHSVNHTLRLTLLVTFVAIAIPCSFAPSILPLWLRGKLYTPDMAMVMACMGFYYALNVFYGVNAQIINAAGKPQIVFPFTMMNGLTTALVTGWAAMNYGIAGVAVMNAGILVTQFWPLVYVSVRLAMEKAETHRLLRALSGTFVLGIGFCAGGYYGGLSLASVGLPWLFLLAVPVWSATFGYAVVKLGLSPRPHVVDRGLGVLRKRFGA